MRRIILIISTLLITSSMMGQKYILPTPSHQPSKAQLKLIERRYGMFLHFGLNTFEDEEWTDGTKPAPPTIAPAPSMPSNGCVQRATPA